MGFSTGRSSAPGLSLRTLLLQSKPAPLRRLIGAENAAILENLDPGIVQGNALGQVVANFIEPSEALRDPDKRDQIIALLPLPKARELARRLRVKDDRDLYGRLQQAASDRTVLPELLSFFGVVHDERSAIDTVPSIVAARAHYALFDHQRTVAARVTRALDIPPRKVVLHMPAGSGKTRTAMHIVSAHLRRFEPTVVCWLAQNAELLDQAACEFDQAWGYLGNRSVELVRFWGSRHPNLMDVRDGLVVAGLSKMHAYDRRYPESMLRLSDRTSLIVIDEAHQAIAPTYASILAALHTKRSTNALLGLTATPGRTWSDIAEDKRLSDYFENQKVTLDVKGRVDPVTFLINEGYLAKPTLRTLNSEAGLALSRQDVLRLSQAIDVPESVLKKIGTDSRRNLKIVSAIEDLMERHRRIIVFAPSVSSARLLHAIMRARKKEVYVVTAHTHGTERERIVARFRSNVSWSMAMINYGVLTTGFDAPSTSAAIIARPTKSLVLYSQMVGRATRGPQAGGNLEAEIITIVDPHLPGFGSIADSFRNWEDVWREGQ